MNVNKINEILNEYAPLNLSTEFVKMINGYDNSGIIVDTGAEVKGVLFSLDLTLNAVENAIKNNCNLIITHHPAIYKGVSSLDKNSPILQAVKNDISVISYHLNLDCAKYGIDYYLANGLGAKEQTIYHSLGDGVGYGRKFTLENATFLQVVEKYKQTFNSQKVITYGNLDEKVEKVATFCGSGLDEQELLLASDCDLVISADVPHHVILSAVSQNKKLMLITHYSCEFYGFSKFYEHFSNKLGVKAILFKEEIYL